MADLLRMLNQAFRWSTLALLLGLVSACGGGSGGGGGAFFPVNTDAQDVAEAKAALAIIYAPGDSASGVTRDVGLPVEGLHKVSVSWSSNNPDGIADSGTVTRPTTGGNVIVILTATLRKGSSSDTKIFSVILLSTSASIATTEGVQASGGSQVSGAAENTAFAGEGVTHDTATQGNHSNRTGFQPPLP